MGPEDAEVGAGGAATQDAAEESAPWTEAITTENPQRPTDRREAVAVARRTVAAARERQRDESAPRPEPITTENPQRPTDRREAVAVARRTVAAARERQRAAG